MSREGKSKHQLWQELCLLISKNPEKVRGQSEYTASCVPLCVHTYWDNVDTQMEKGG